jgi:hypothetical protein
MNAILLSLVLAARPMPADPPAKIAYRNPMVDCIVAPVDSLDDRDWKKYFTKGRPIDDATVKALARQASPVTLEEGPKPDGDFKDVRKFALSVEQFTDFANTCEVLRRKTLRQLKTAQRISRDEKQARHDIELRKTFIYPSLDNAKIRRTGEIGSLWGKVELADKVPGCSSIGLFFLSHQEAVVRGDKYVTVDKAEETFSIYSPSIMAKLRPDQLYEWGGQLFIVFDAHTVGDEVTADRTGKRFLKTGRQAYMIHLLPLKMAPFAEYNWLRYGPVQKKPAASKD